MTDPNTGEPIGSTAAPGPQLHCSSLYFFGSLANAMISSAVPRAAAPLHHDAVAQRLAAGVGSTAASGLRLRYSPRSAMSPVLSTADFPWPPGCGSVAAGRC